MHQTMNAVVPPTESDMMIQPELVMKNLLTEPLAPSIF